ncbi:hypothetical protein [Xylanimonas protaetiae]|uniref:hypothetical protein n=1 Tax=Xylanimonas protaetiae TaxID=2509457 RepID=UPI0013EE0D9B|nr:hypothetical protein [Xylanimonas protaetiae]
MTWPSIALITYLALSALIVIAGVGKPREPITPGLAVGTVVTTAALITLVVIA